jgi:hypothetical protein
MFKYFISWCVLIFSTSAFLFKGLGKGDRVMDIMILSVIIFLVLLHAVYQGKIVMKANFRTHISILLLSLIGSVLMADMFHGQSYSLTLIQQRPIYFYLFYILLHYMLPDPKKIERMLVIFGSIYCLFYIIQTIVYPRLITDALVFRDRNTIRIFLPGEIFMVMGYFISFDKIFSKFSWLYLCHIILSMTVVLLLGSRTMLMSFAVLSFANIMINKRVKNRIAIFFLFAGVAFISFWSMKDVITAMIMETQKNSSQSDNYIRVKAAEYYIWDFPTNLACSVLGNGNPNENSVYGLQVKRVKDYMAFYLSDIGIIGIYAKYGLFFAITCLVILFKCIFSKLHREVMYVKYFMVYLLFTLVFTVLPFESADGIVGLCIILYTIDCYKDGTLITETTGNKK